MILPYYKINKTEKDKHCFYTHKGYFNFWDEYLIMNACNKDLFTVLVNRINRKFNRAVEPTEKYKTIILTNICYSAYFRKPKKMFVDFPELDEINKR